MPRTESDAANQRLTEQIGELKDRMNRTEGKGLGLNAGWAYLVGGVAVVATVLTLVLALTR